MVAETVSEVRSLRIGRVSGIFTSSLIHVALAANSLPVALQPTISGLKWMDSLLLTLGVGAFFVFWISVWYVFRVARQYVPARQALKLAFVRRSVDPGQHFAEYVPRAQDQGEMLVPYSTWKRVVTTQKHCRLAVASMLVGKVVVAAVVTVLFIRAGIF